MLFVVLCGIVGLVVCFNFMSRRTTYLTENTAAIFLRRSNEPDYQSRSLLSLDPRTIITKSTEYMHVHGTADDHQQQQEDAGKWEQVQTFVGVINTPKCGTGGLSGSFVNAFDPCNEATRPFPSTVRYDCPEQRHIVRAHNVDGAVQVYKNVRDRHPIQKCFLVTAIRGPQEWLPSLFLQRHEESLCNAEMSSKEEMMDLYRHWLLNESDQVREAAGSVRPVLFNEFGQTTLTEQMQRVEENGGYAFLSPPPQSEEQPSNFPNCELLFLRMEDKDRWSEIIHRFMPGVRYERNRSRTEQCPNIAEYYLAIQEYRLNSAELKAVIQNDPHTAEYFRVYGYNGV